MNLLIWILLFCGLLTVLLINCPIVVQVKSQWVCLIKWTLIKFRVVFVDRQTHIELIVLNLRFPLKEKKASVKKTKKPSKKKAKKKLPFESLKEVAFDKVIARLIMLFVHFCRRLLKAITISGVKCNIGLNDYYQQGILIGWLAGLPRGPNFQISGNFEEVSDIDLKLRISLWRILWAVTLLIFSFPYYRTIKLLLKVRRNMVVVESA